MVYNQVRDWWFENYSQFKHDTSPFERSFLDRMAQVTLDPDTCCHGYHTNYNGYISEVLCKGLLDCIFAGTQTYQTQITTRNEDRRGIDLEVRTAHEGHMPIGIDVKTGPCYGYFGEINLSEEHPALPFWRIRMKAGDLGVSQMRQLHQADSFPSPLEFMEERLRTNSSLQQAVYCLQGKASQILAAYPNLNGTGEFLRDLVAYRYPEIVDWGDIKIRGYNLPREKYPVPLQGANSFSDNFIY